MQQDGGQRHSRTREGSSGYLSASMRRALPLRASSARKSAASMPSAARHSRQLALTTASQLSSGSLWQQCGTARACSATGMCTLLARPHLRRARWSMLLLLRRACCVGPDEADLHVLLSLASFRRNSPLIPLARSGWTRDASDTGCRQITLRQTLAFQWIRYTQSCSTRPSSR